LVDLFEKHLKIRGDFSPPKFRPLENIHPLLWLPSHHHNGCCQIHHYAILLQ